MVKWVETRDWEQAFYSIIPQRKFQKDRKGVEAGTRKQSEEDGATVVVTEGIDEVKDETLNVDDSVVEHLEKNTVEADMEGAEPEGRGMKVETVERENSSSSHKVAAVAA